VGKSFEKGLYNMKVGFCLDVNKEDANSGKHKFFIRLASEMKKNKIKIDNKKPDVYVFMAGYKINSKAKVNILRLDGLIMNTRWDYKSKNKRILKSIKNSDALIYQGKFCKDAYNKFLGVKDNKKYAIIPNGASLNEFAYRNVENYFLANCKWRPHKRLKCIVESFLLALDMGLDSDLIVTGEPDHVVKHPRIRYIKWQNKKQLIGFLSGSIASLHLTWLDWCPNSMVEAIVAGCPVIYTMSGGHSELAEGSGIGIKDKKWNFKLIDLYSPPKINKEEVAKSMLKIKKNNMIFNKREDLYISSICDRYLDFFNKLLKK
jgi:glycosyltransferase involved in cell wall biosynthesis